MRIALADARFHGAGLLSSISVQMTAHSRVYAITCSQPFGVECDGSSGDQVLHVSRRLLQQNSGHQSHEKDIARNTSVLAYCNMDSTMTKTRG